MKINRTKAITNCSFFIFMLFFSINLFAQLDSISYNNPDGSKNWWYIQKDVYAFRLINGQEFNVNTLNASIVDSIH